MNARTTRPHKKADKQTMIQSVNSEDDKQNTKAFHKSQLKRLKKADSKLSSL